MNRKEKIKNIQYKFENIKLNKFNYLFLNGFINKNLIIIKINQSIRNCYKKFLCDSLKKFKIF